MSSDENLITTSLPERGLGEHNNQIVSVQYLRALASILVLFFHSSEGNFQAGASGVDIFFVISGFIIVTVFDRKKQTVTGFFYNRVTRVAPLYWIVTIALALSALLFPHLFNRLRPNLPEIITSLLFIPHLNSEGQAWPLLIPGWTLNLEILFYVMFSVLFLSVNRNKFLLLSAGLCILSFSSLFVLRTDAWARTYLNPLFLEFLGGVWIGRFWATRQLPSVRLGEFMIGGAILILAATALPNDFDLAYALPLRPEWPRVIFWGLPSLALVTGALSLELHGKIFVSRFLLLLGDSSYALYLIQGLVIAAVGKFVPGYRILFEVLASILIAILVHRLVERPLTNWVRSFRRRRPG